MGLLFLIAACIFFALDMLGVPAPSRIKWQSAGLLCLAVAMALPAFLTLR